MVECCFSSEELLYLVVPSFHRLVGSFALWGGLFSLTDCTLIHLRNKEDYLNPIAAGFFTGGFLAIRGNLDCLID
jgi:hypothetical protein